MKENLSVLALHPNTIIAASLLLGVSTGLFLLSSTPKGGLGWPFNKITSFFTNSFDKSSAPEWVWTSKGKLCKKLYLILEDPNADKERVYAHLRETLRELRLQQIKDIIPRHETDLIRIVSENIKREIDPLSQPELVKSILRSLDCRSYLKNAPIDLPKFKKEIVEELVRNIPVETNNTSFVGVQERFRSAVESTYNSGNECTLAQQFELNKNIDLSPLKKLLENLSYTYCNSNNDPKALQEIYTKMQALGEEGQLLEVACRRFADISAQSQSFYAASYKKAEFVVGQFMARIPPETLNPGASPAQTSAFKNQLIGNLVHNPGALELFQNLPPIL